MKTNHVDGKNKGKVMLYALSTCVWCGRTKRLLDELGVAYDYVDVDMLEPKDKQKALDEVGKYNPARTFPTVIINNIAIRGFKEAEVRQMLG